MPWVLRCQTSTDFYIQRCTWIESLPVDLTRELQKQDFMGALGVLLHGSSNENNFDVCQVRSGVTS